MTRDVHSTGKQVLHHPSGITVAWCCGQHTLKFSVQLMPYIGKTLHARGFPAGVYTVTLRWKVNHLAHTELFTLRGYDVKTHTGIVKVKPPGDRIAWSGHLLFPNTHPEPSQHLLRCIAKLIVDSTKGASPN